MPVVNREPLPYLFTNQIPTYNETKSQILQHC